MSEVVCDERGLYVTLSESIGELHDGNGQDADSH